MGRLTRVLFAIAPAEVTFTRRGFHRGDGAAVERLELVSRTFLTGYHAALGEPRAAALELRLPRFDEELAGFAFEGAAMGLGILDALSPWPGGRVGRYLAGPAAPHVYVAHVGVGWALARLPFATRRLLAPLDPLLRWLTFDGHGFHDGFFDPARTVHRQAAPERLHGYACRVYDQGLGRSLWFSAGADPRRIAAAIGAFAAARRADLWSGVGLACAYAGGVDAGALDCLRTLAGWYLPHVAQGAAFGAKARHRAGNLTPSTDRACRSLCGIAAEEAAAVTDAAAAALPTHLAGGPSGHDAEPLWESWRSLTRRRFAALEAIPG